MYRGWTSERATLSAKKLNSASHQTLLDVPTVSFSHHLPLFNTTFTMANQASASRRPKRSGVSSAKDSTLGKRVVPDPRVRVQSIKAACVNDDPEDDNSRAGPSSSPSSSSAPSASNSTAVNPTVSGPSSSSSSSRKPNWKRLPLKRSIPHCLLVRPCGPGKIIMPSVPRRKPPKDDEDDDATDKEPDSENPVPQTTSTSTSVTPPSTTPPLTTPPSTTPPSTTPLSTTPPSTTQHPTNQPSVMPSAQPDSNTELNIEPTTTIPKGPVFEDLNSPSCSNNGSVTNVGPMMSPDALRSGTNPGSMSVTPMIQSGYAATGQTTHSLTSLTAGSGEHRSHPTGNLAELGFLRQKPHPIADMLIANHDYPRASELGDQGTGEVPFDDRVSSQQHYHDANTRSTMDIDVEMDDSPQPPIYHAPTNQLLPFEIPRPAFTISAFQVSQQVPLLPAVEPNQLTQHVYFQYAASGNQGQHENSLDLSLNNHQSTLPVLSTSPSEFGSFHQHLAQSGYDSHAASAHSNEGSMPGTNYQPPVVSFDEPQWQPHIQLASSAPASYTPNALYSDIGQVQVPAFYPHISYPLPIPPVHQQLLLSDLQPVNSDHVCGLEDVNTRLPSDGPCSSFTPPARRTTIAVQQKTSIALEPVTEWARRVAEVQQRKRSNPFHSSYPSRPVLIPQVGESEPRLYHPLPSRSGVSSMGKTPAPPASVGSEADLVARLALERRLHAEEGRRALRREKRKKSTRRESNEEEIPVKKQKVRNELTASHNESSSHMPRTIISRPAVKPKPLARTRSCPSVSSMMKAVLRL